MQSLKDQFSKVMRKLNDQDKLIKTLKLSNVVQMEEVQLLRQRKRACQNREALEAKHLETMMSGLCRMMEGSCQGSFSNLKGFISMQFREEIEGTEDILVIDDPDSTTGGTKKKKKKKKATKRIEDSDKDSNASEVLLCSQLPPKRCRISRNRSSALYEPPSPKDHQSGEDSGNEDEVKKL